VSPEADKPPVVSKASPPHAPPTTIYLRMRVFNAPPAQAQHVIKLVSDSTQSEPHVLHAPLLLLVDVLQDVLLQDGTLSPQQPPPLSVPVLHVVPEPQYVPPQWQQLVSLDIT